MSPKLLLVGALLCQLLLAAQPKGHALLIGANKTFNPNLFDNASVAKAKEDAVLIRDILFASGFKEQDIILLSDETATAANIDKEMKSFAKKVKKGDLFVFYFSGHGDTIPDINHDEIPFSFDQELVLKDGKLVDDRLFNLFGEFKDSVRFVFIADACFSGQMYQWDKKYYGASGSNKSVYYSATSDAYADSGCDVITDYSAFNMIYVGAVDRDATSEPYQDGSGRLTRWIHDAWRFYTEKNLLHTLTMLDFFRQACYSSSETIVTLVTVSGQDLFGKTPLFKL